jgi:phosphonate transport system permease protein
MLFGTVPAVLSDLVSYSFYRFECGLRSAAVLGIVGAGGLGFQLALSFQSLRYAGSAQTKRSGDRDAHRR